MANPFETFAYRQTAPAVAAVKGNAPQQAAAPGRPPTRHSPSPGDPIQNTLKRRTRHVCEPSMLSDSDIKQQQAVSPAAQITDQAAIRSSPRVKQPSSTTPSPGAAKKRKAYASLTGPPKGLGPKLGTSPLRLILVGHNPSEHAFHTGHFYSNPSNRMWSILISTGIAPPGTIGPEADDSMPTEVGVGFVDVGSGEPGTDSALFTSGDFLRWRGGFYDRLKQHVAAASQSIGCTCGLCGAPALIAFTGKRQYLELLNIDASGQLRRGKSKVASTAVQLGKQPPNMLPPGWPLTVDRTEVWVLTSTSGAAPMSNADRERPYKQLAERLAEVPWPRSDVVLSCCS